MSKQALEKLIREPGDQSALAAKLQALGYKVKQGHIWNWLNKNRPDRTPPSEFVIGICLAYSWDVTPHDLRPDLYPNPWDGLPPDVAMAKFPGVLLSAAA